MRPAFRRWEYTWWRSWKWSFECPPGGEECWAWIVSRLLRVLRQNDFVQKGMKWPSSVSMTQKGHWRASWAIATSGTPCAIPSCPRIVWRTSGRRPAGRRPRLPHAVQTKSGAVPTAWCDRPSGGSDHDVVAAFGMTIIDGIVRPEHPAAQVLEMVGRRNCACLYLSHLRREVEFWV